MTVRLAVIRVSIVGRLAAMAARTAMTERAAGSRFAVLARPRGSAAPTERCERLLDAIDRIAVTVAAVLLAHPSRLHVT
ncbi:hypothetical protein [Agromyces sp. GXS1127]|uniref:hypothetical protein n=1 Tax=Agromyces sp. GXS1127 TaxID=3424181 RepID=UPI003D31A234